MLSRTLKKFIEVKAASEAGNDPDMLLASMLKCCVRNNCFVLLDDLKNNFVHAETASKRIVP